MKGERMIAAGAMAAILWLWAVVALAVFYVPRLAERWTETNPEQPLSAVQILAVRGSMLIMTHVAGVGLILLPATIAVTVWVIVAFLRRDTVPAS